jgi:phosphate-selective porin
MLPNKTKWLALLGVATALTGIAFAQSTADQALINALIKKGILTDKEAKDISAEVAKSQAAEDVETSGDKILQKLVINGRFQAQYDGLGTSISGGVNPASTEHFLLRRMYIGAIASFGDGWSGVLNYDLANTSFDKAYIEWKQSPLFTVQAGFNKAPFGYEELTSSGNLRAIERSPITRYIDEPNNGRRLGASSYRTGLFALGTMDGFFYSVALTNPERNEYGGDGTNTSILVNGLGGVGSTGTGTTNKFAGYATVGYGGTFDFGGGMKDTYKLGYETGYLPDQGGPGATIGTGRNITLNGVFFDTTAGGFNLQGEWEEAQDDSGVKNGVSATPKGYWIQPAYKFTPEWEAVVRYSYVDSNGRGVALSDGVRGAPSGGTMNKMDEWYVGFNYYIKGNDVKLQTGYIHGESNDTVTGGSAQAQTDGIRSQVQVNF